MDHNWWTGWLMYWLTIATNFHDCDYVCNWTIFSFMHKLLTISNSFLPSGTVNSSNATCELWGIRNKNLTQGTGSQRRGHGTRPIKMQPLWRKRPRRLCQGHRTAQHLWRQVTLVKAMWLSRASLMERRIRNCAHHFQVRAVGTIFCQSLGVEKKKKYLRPAQRTMLLCLYTRIDSWTLYTCNHSWIHSYSLIAILLIMYKSCSCREEWTVHWNCRTLVLDKNILLSQIFVTWLKEVAPMV